MSISLLEKKQHMSAAKMEASIGTSLREKSSGNSGDPGTSYATFPQSPVRIWKSQLSKCLLVHQKLIVQVGLIPEPIWDS